MSGNVKKSSLRVDKIKDYIITNNFIVAFVVLFVLSSFLSPSFLTTTNMVNLLRQQSAALVVAYGLLFTLITGGIDLSVGSTVCLSGIVLGTTLMKWNWDGPAGLIAGILLAVLSGAAVGFLNGIMINLLKLPPFIVTLAMQFSIRGLANVFCNGQPIRALNETWAYQKLIGFSATGSDIFGIPYPFVLVIIIALILGFVLKQTSYGRLITATGSNATAVHLAGVPIRKYQISVYVVSGLMSGIAGVMLSSRANVFSPTAATSYEMNAIAGSVIGGASLTGGSGSIFGVVMGVFVLAMLENIMNLMALPPFPQQVIKGIIIIAAVFLQTVTASRRVDGPKRKKAA